MFGMNDGMFVELKYLKIHSCLVWGFESLQSFKFRIAHSIDYGSINVPTFSQKANC